VLKDERIGAVLEFRLHEGEVRTQKAKRQFDIAIEDGVNAVWRFLCTRVFKSTIEFVPSFRPQLGLKTELLESAEGASVGLAAALEAFGSITGVKPCRHVIASGTVTKEGALMAANDLDLKLQAVQRECWAEVDAMFLSACRFPAGETVDVSSTDSAKHVPQCATVCTLEEALNLVFGRRAVAEATVPPQYLSGHKFVRQVERLIQQRDFEQAIEKAKQGLAAGFGGDVPLQLRWYAARAALHKGETETSQQYAQCLELAEKMASQGQFEDKKYKLFLVEKTMSEMDLFGVDDAIERLQKINADPGLNVVVRIDVQGTLAQALAMTGRYEEAVEYRVLNKKQQEKGGFEGIEDTLGRTCCCLAWERYLAGDESGAWQALSEAERAIKRHSAEPFQKLFNLYTAVRMDLWSARPETVLDRIQEAVSDGIISSCTSASESYPVSMIRLVQAAARIECGAYKEGIEQLAALRQTCFEGKQVKKNVVSWLTHLGLGWEIFAHLQQGESDIAAQKNTLAHKALAGEDWNDKLTLFPPAARFFTQKFGPLANKPQAAARRIREWYGASWY
jgi:hypothetical protein